MFLSVYVWVRQWGALKLHPSNSVTQKLFLSAQFDPSFKFWGHEELHFILLVVSTVSTFSTVSSQASEHSAVLFTAHTTLSQHVLFAYLNHIHCPHLPRQLGIITYFISFLEMATIPSPPSDLLGPLNAPLAHLRMMVEFYIWGSNIFYCSYNKHNNILLGQHRFIPMEIKKH